MSSETPSPNLKKIKSAHSYIFLAAALTVMFLGVFLVQPENSGEPFVDLGGKRFQVEVVADDISRIQGLSGRESLSRDEGMLFVFDRAGKYCFWMKDMNFAIDMLWLDRSGKVVHMAENASPDSYPQQFCPEVEAKYVLEVNAGIAKSLDVKSGDKAAISY